MTAAIAAEPSAPATTGERFDPALPIALIVPSPLNPRKHFDKAKLRELAESLRTKGQLTPVLARPIKGGRYELAAGHRRHAAAPDAGMDTLAAVIRPMDDDTFLLVLTVENMQREDLTPLEEAAGYDALRRLAHYEVPTIAAKVAKSESYVYRRLALQQLIAPAKKALEAGTIELGHAEILARLDEATQKAMLPRCDREKNRWDYVTVAQLRQYVQREKLLQLSAAPWKLSDATLPGGACASCPKRTGATPALFSDLADDDRCLDGACHAAKLKAFLDRRRAELTAEHGKELVLLDRTQTYSTHSNIKGAVGAGGLTIHKKAVPGSKPALIVAADGGDVGHLVHVKQQATVRQIISAGEQARRQEIRQKEERARHRTKAHVAAAIAAAAKADVTALAKVPQLAVLVAGEVQRADGEVAQRLKSVDWIPAPLTKRPDGLQALVAVEKMSASEQARLFLLLNLLPYVHVSPWYGEKRAATLTRFCNELGVSVKAHVAAADKAERAAKKAKAARHPAKKAAKRRAGDVAAERKAKRAQPQHDEGEDIDA